MDKTDGFTLCFLNTRIFQDRRSAVTKRDAIDVKWRGLTLSIVRITENQRQSFFS